MSKQTGHTIEDMDHLHQSVGDILTTPVGSRVMRRDYGSLLPELLDQPLNEATLLRVYAAAIMALLRWEPRLLITRIERHPSASQPGRLLLRITGQTQDNPDTSLEVSL